ncbi:MAG: pyruvate ferredoxin oxidoreductase [Candidatus Heimdallarchaeota archaeon]|nr:pyruvate ferredoxin oxidoreductase [Candidatus Heimdallarchaeota archaeon]
MIELPSIKTREIAEQDNVLTGGHRLCAGCSAGTMARQVTLAAQALDEPFMITHATGCLEVATTIYPYTAWKAPWLHNAFENASATASGAIEALNTMKRKGLIENKKTNMILFGGDGGTYDIGIQSLSGAVERGHDFLYVCYNNGGYMNTGIQRSGGTPMAAATTTSPAGKVIPGKIKWAKPLPEIMAAHDIPVATASPAYYKDLMQKVQAGIKYEGPAFILVDSPCTLGQRFEPGISLKTTELAVKSAFFPLYRTYKDEWELTGETKRIAEGKREKIPVVDYLKVQGRFKHVFKPEWKDILVEIQETVDERWARLLKKAGY